MGSKDTKQESDKESSEMFSTILDSLDVVVYVVDMESYDILFVDKYTRDLFGDVVGKTCWKTFQAGQSGPCDFCTNEKLVDAEGEPVGTYTWEHYNENTKSWYSIRDRAIRWLDGRIVRLEIAVDITKQKENELDRTLFSGIIESSLNEIYVFDARTFYFINVNTGALKNLGYTHKEMKSKTPLDIIPEFDESSFNSLITPLLEQKEDIIEFQTIHRRSDGSLYPVEVHLQLIKDVGKPVFLAIILDITQRKQAEEVMQLNELRMKSLVELGQMTHSTFLETADFVLDKAVLLTKSKFGFIGLMNKDESILTIHVWSNEIMSECAIDDRQINFPIMDAGVWADAIRQRKTIVINDYLAPNPHKKGIPESHIQLLRLMSIPIFEDEKIVALAAVANKGKEYDDSDMRQIKLLLDGMWKLIQRKKAEDELVKKNRNLSVLYSTASIATEYSDIDNILSELLVYVLDYLGSEAGGIYLIDERSDEVVLRVHQGLSDEFLQKVSHVPLNEPIVAEVLASKDIFIKEPYHNKEMIRWEKDQGTKKIVIVKLMSRDKIIGFANIVIPAEHEISKEDIPVLESIGKQAGSVIDNLNLFEETQIANEELKSLDMMKDEFLSNVTHELKTPITSIKGYSELMVNGKLGELTKKQKNALDAVIRNSERLNRLIDSLVYLTLVRIGKVKYNFGQVQIGQIIDNAVWDISPLVEKKGLTIEKNIPPSLPSINGDEDKITEVLINLIENAIKFTPSGGRITVAVDVENDNLHITVSDTGIGIPPEYIKSMFQEFYQVDTSTTRNKSGTGLGLFISKSIIEAHNGNIWAESKVGIGTTIHLILPK